MDDRPSANCSHRPSYRHCASAWSALQISNRLFLPEQETRRKSASIPRGAPQGRYLITVEAERLLCSLTRSSSRHKCDRQSEIGIRPLVFGVGTSSVLRAQAALDRGIVMAVLAHRAL